MSRKWLRAGLSFLSLLTAALLASLVAVADEPTPTPSIDRPGLTARLEKDLLPFLSKHCLDCHAPSAKGFDKHGLDLSRLKTLDDALKGGRALRRIREAVGDGEMPPPEKPRPDVAERDRALDAVRELAVAASLAAPRGPGRVLPRRLNRYEYDRTVSDLLGKEMRLSDAFPADDRGYGFDNIADVLTLSPLQVEKYLTAAEAALAQTIRTADAKPTSWKTGGAATEPAEGRPDQGTTRGLFTRTACYVRRKLPFDGTYVLRAQLFADQAGPEPARAALGVDGDGRKTVDVKAVRGKPETFEVRLPSLKAGEHRFSVAFLNDYYEPDAQPPAGKDRNLYVDWIEVEGPFDAPIPETHERIFIAKPSKALPEAECAKKILEPFLARAFRRPPTSEELNRYVALVKSRRGKKDLKETFEASVGVALTAALVAPQFLYRIEADPKPPAKERALDGFELASRLSYFLWASMPDEALFAAAREGRLAAEPATRTAEVKRMLSHPRARSLVDGFAAQWLELRNLDLSRPDRERFPEWDEDLRRAMRLETELLFECLVKEDRPVTDLLGADFTFLNERLARHYGLDGVEGDEMRRVPTKGTSRGGILTHGAILTITSGSTRTNPPRRGRFVLEQLLGAPPPPPPPGVPPLEEGEAAEKARSLRGRFERHRQDPACMGCHVRIDPIGFALERFDAIGRERTSDGAFPIDERGDLPDGAKVEGPRGLTRHILERKDAFARAFAERLLTYALGRGIEPEDARELDAITARASEGGLRFSAFVHAIVESPLFLSRGAP